jgi:hypothetical protein
VGNVLAGGDHGQATSLTASEGTSGGFRPRLDTGQVNAVTGYYARRGFCNTPLWRLREAGGASEPGAGGLRGDRQVWACALHQRDVREGSLVRRSAGRGWESAALKANKARMISRTFSLA